MLLSYNLVALSRTSKLYYERYILYLKYWKKLNPKIENELYQIRQYYMQLGKRRKCMFCRLIKSHSLDRTTYMINILFDKNFNREIALSELPDVNIELINMRLCHIGKIKSNNSKLIDHRRLCYIKGTRKQIVTY